MNRSAGSLVGIFWLFSASVASADIAAGLNRIRQHGCDERPGVARALRPSRGLQEVAREWSKGGPLREAIARTDYRILSSASMHVSGAKDERTLLELLERSYCHVIVNPEFTEIGIFDAEEHVWIVVASPFAAPASSDARQVTERALELVNAARSKPRQCGNAALAAVEPLKLSSALTQAALAHAQDMATKDFFEHQGSDGSQPADRITRAGYRWRSVGENIAVGAADADTVVRGWLDSPRHCVNIMSPLFSEMGLAYVVDRKSRGGIYWVQVFGTPRGRSSGR